MIFPSPFPMMMIGGAIINEWQNADQREYLQSVEQRTGQLERRVQSTIDNYQQLGEAFIKLQEYAASIEGERDELQYELQTVINHFRALHAEFKEFTLEFQKVKETAEKWDQENSKKLYMYDLIKKLLTSLSAHGDQVFTPEFIAEHGEKLARFVEQLPE